MKPMTFLNDCVLSRLDETNVITATLSSIEIPSKIFFSLPPIPHLTPDAFSKSAWNFGDGTKVAVITTRKTSILDEIPHIFRLKNVNDPNTTLTIQASVFTDDEVFVTKPLVVDKITFKAESNNYVDPEEFKQDILNYYNTNVITDRLATSIKEISNRLSYAPNFINYTYREDMIGDALIKMMQALKDKKFDPLKGNPFSYFTKIAFHAFCNRIKKEKKNRDTLSSYQAEVYEDTMRVYGCNVSYGSHDSEDEFSDYS